MTDCYCRAWDEGRVLVILETGFDPGPAHTQPSWIIPCHGVGQPVPDRNDQTNLEDA